MVRNLATTHRLDQVAHHRAPQSFVADQVIVQQHQNVVGMEKMPLVIDHAQPVRVAVRGDSQIVVPLHHLVLERPQGVRRGSRKPSAEQRVVLLVNHVQITAPGDQNGA